MDGILNLCKPRGMSSFQALTVVKRRLHLTKVGHLGTLDPAACGVLVLLCGRATKLADQLHGGAKVYRTLVTWGRATDTWDDEGQITATSNVIPTTAAVQTVLPTMVGDLEITVPKFSAVHINGQRAYDLARKGIEFTPPQRIVQVNEFRLLTLDDCVKDLQAIGEEYTIPPQAHYFEIVCQTGTYIRSLVQLLAARLGTVATASLIMRTQVGKYSIRDAKSLQTVQLSDLQQLEDC